MGFFRRTPAPAAPTDRGGPWGEAFLESLRSGFPWLTDVDVGVPGVPPGSAGMGDPMSWPDGGEARWYYYPYPRPPGISGPRFEYAPHLFGRNEHRVWAIDFQFLSKSNAERRPMVRFRTFTRLVRPGSELTSVPPWAILSPPTDSPMFRYPRTTSLTNKHVPPTYSVQRISLSILEKSMGGPLPAGLLPGLQFPVVAFGSDPRLTGAVRTAAILNAYAAWDALGGSPSENPVQLHPILDAHAFRVQAWAPLGPKAQPGDVTRAFGRFMEVVTSLENSLGVPPLEAELDQIPLPSPAPAVADFRPGVLCSACGQIEGVRSRGSSGGRPFGVETIRCGRPVFSG